MLTRVVCALALIASGTGHAASAVTGFYSGGKLRSLQVEKDHVVVKASGATSAATSSPTFARTEHEAFARMGVEAVERSKVRAATDIVGYPIWFDKAKGAVGVLTHEIVVRVEGKAAVKALKAQPGFAAMRETTFRKGLYLAKFESPMAALTAANALHGKPGVRYAHPNFMIPKVFRGPESEPLFTHQWHLENVGQRGGTSGADVHAKAAWDVTTGDANVLVAVLDGGFEMAHPDLDGAWRLNAGEIPGNGVDDDANGYVDDVSGWNFWANSNDPSAAVVDDHGTAVAGLVGARANGKGVTGVCPECSMLPVVVNWNAVDDAAAFHYAGKMGAMIITNSWGYAIGTPTTDVVEEAITEVAHSGRDGKGTIILFAMNNYNQDDCIGDEPDISSLDAVIAVSASSDLDKKVTYSAWGDCMEFLSTSLESGRAGIATTDLSGDRGYNTGRSPGELPDLAYTNDFGGTSAATPIAAGAFGLMLSVNPALTRDEALALVLSTADKIQPETAAYDPQTGFSKKYGYGRINVGKAMRAAHVFKKYSKKDAAKTDTSRTVRQ